MRVVLWSLSASLLLAPAFSFADSDAIYNRDGRYGSRADSDSKEDPRRDRVPEKGKESPDSDKEEVVRLPPDYKEEDPTQNKPQDPTEVPTRYSSLSVGNTSPTDGAWDSSGAFEYYPVGYQQGPGGGSAPPAAPEEGLIQEVEVPEDLTQQVTAESLKLVTKGDGKDSSVYEGGEKFIPR